MHFLAGALSCAVSERLFACALFRRRFLLALLCKIFFVHFSQVFSPRAFSQGFSRGFFLGASSVSSFAWTSCMDSSPGSFSVRTLGGNFWCATSLCRFIAVAYSVRSVKENLFGAHFRTIKYSALFRGGLFGAFFLWRFFSLPFHSAFLSALTSGGFFLSLFRSGFPCDFLQQLFPCALCKGFSVRSFTGAYSVVFFLPGRGFRVLFCSSFFSPALLVKDCVVRSTTSAFSVDFLKGTLSVRSFAGAFFALFHSSFFLRCFLSESFVHSFAGVFSVCSFAGIFYASPFVRASSVHFLKCPLPWASSLGLFQCSLSRGCLPRHSFAAVMSMSSSPRALSLRFSEMALCLCSFAGAFPVRFFAGTPSVRLSAEDFLRAFYLSGFCRTLFRRIFPWAFFRVHFFRIDDLQWLIARLLPCVLSEWFFQFALIRAFLPCTVSRGRFRCAILREIFRCFFNPCLHHALFRRGNFHGFIRRGFSVSFLAVDISLLPFAGVFAVFSFAVHFPHALS